MECDYSLKKRKMFVTTYFSFNLPNLLKITFPSMGQLNPDWFLFIINQESYIVANVT